MINKPVCVFQAPLFVRAGYGDWALEIAKSLVRYDKYDLKILPTRWGSCSKKNLEAEINDPLEQELLKKVLKHPLEAQPELFVQVTIPNEFLLTPNGYMKIGKYNIGMTAGIETTVPRAEWIEGINRMDLNVVMSQHGKDIFTYAEYSKSLPGGIVEDLRVNRPIEILPWGIDTSIYYKTDKTIDGLELQMSKIPEDFAFLFVGQWTSGNINSDRKAIGFLIKTFLETFKNLPSPPCLILKTSGASLSVLDRSECLSKIKEVTDIVKNENPTITSFPNVYLIHGELTNEEMNALYNHKKVKIHVSFTHGEGFGGPLLISTLSGKPLFAPAWSGHLDFLNQKYANLLQGELVPIPDEAVNDWFVKDAKWFNVDYKKASQRFLHAYNNYELYLENAELLRQENSIKFSTQTTDKIFHNLLDKYVPKFAVQQPIIIPKLKTLNLPKLNKQHE
jgi:hypothetical protein